MYVAADLQILWVEGKAPEVYCFGKSPVYFKYSKNFQ